MKVVFVHFYSLTFGAGGEKFIVDASNRLIREGYEVEVRALPINRKPTHRLQSLDPTIKYTEAWFHSFEADVAYYVYSPLITLFCKTDAPKIAGLRAFICAPQAQAPEAVPRNPLLWIKRNGFQSTVTYYLYECLGRRDLEKFCAVHVINEVIRCNHQKRVYVPLWVDTSFYRDFNERNGDFTVVFVGRHDWRKGFNTFVESARIIHRLSNDIHFLCTGSGVEGVVTGLGHLNDREIVDLYNHSHLIVYPSRIDTFGNVILESLSCGVPIVTTPIGSHTAIKLPLLYASTPKDFVDKILMMRNMWKNDESKYIDLCLRVRESVMKYGVKTVFPRFESMLQDEIIKSG